MTYATPQRIIIISINGIDRHAQVRYSFDSPVTGHTHRDAPKCDMVVDQAVYSLFVLDYTSTLNGWTIRKTSPREDSHALTHVPGAFHLSLLTYNPYTTEHLYRFYIHYRNALNGARMRRDPQEGNIVKPH
jgi:hypothetical protein